MCICGVYKYILSGWGCEVVYEIKDGCVLLVSMCLLSDARVCVYVCVAYCNIYCICISLKLYSIVKVDRQRLVVAVKCQSAMQAMSQQQQQ